MLTQIIAVIFFVIAAILAAKSRRPAAHPMLAPGAVLAALAALVFLVLALFVSDRDPGVETESERISSLRLRIPLAALSHEMGASGRIAVLVIANNDGAAYPEATASVAAWQKAFPSHEFVVITTRHDDLPPRPDARPDSLPTTRPDDLPTTLRRLARDNVAVVLFDAFSGDNLDAAFLEGDETVLKRPVLCLDPGTTEKLLPLIRSGKIFAGLRTLTNSFKVGPAISDEELFKRHFSLVTRQNAGPPMAAPRDVMQDVQE